MCGINGRIGKNGSFDKFKIQIMNSLIEHRGPDSEGVYFEENIGYSVGMGMRRLAIIDVDGGAQPFFSDDGQIILVFNGEIYNFTELRDELVRKGIKFDTNSDTEVILRLYEDSGIKAFDRLDGMYAFSILDKKRNRVYLSRDYFGEKPLYYCVKDDSLIWSSELKSLVSQFHAKPEIDHRALELYFRLTYIPAPYTIYTGIKKLEANRTLEYNISTGDIAFCKVHQDRSLKRFGGSFSEAKRKTRELLLSSVRSRSKADVPMGAFLSGGVDSSIISLCLSEFGEKKIDTFSIGFENLKYDERSKSREIARLISSNHHEFKVTEKQLADELDAVLSTFDEPFADSSALPSYVVSSLCKGKVKVALTGDGGDEMFGGYNKYQMSRLNRLYTSYVPNSVHGLISTFSPVFLKQQKDLRGRRYKVSRAINSIDYSDEFYWKIISLGSTDSQLNQLFVNHQAKDVFSYYKTITGIDNPSSLQEMRSVDRVLSLEGDMLVKVDRTSMLASIETRAPFLNRDIWDFTSTLPEDYLIKSNRKKYLLKEAFKQDVPDQFFDASKKGFGVPIGDWLKTTLRDELVSYSCENLIKEQGIFNPAGITKIIYNHLSGYEDNTFLVWTYFCFQKWYLSVYKKN